MNIILWAILKRIWPYLAVVALLLGAYGWAHHRGTVAQKAKDDKVIAALKAELAADDASLHEWMHAGDQWKVAQAAQEAAQAAVAKQAAAALAQARARAKAADKALQSALKHPPVCPGQMLPDGVLQ